TGAEMLAELDGGHADAARGAMDQEHFALLEARAMDQRMEGGDRADTERRALGPRPAPGHPHEVAASRHPHIFGHGARAHAEDHLVTGLPGLHLGADGGDRARAFHARDEGQLWLVLVA